MAKLTGSAFLSKWNALFADNTSRNISEEDLRDFRQDINDSFLNLDDQEYSGIKGFKPGINTITALKAIATLNMELNVNVAFRDTDNSDVLRVYELVSGTTIESSPNVIRPNDYAASTNEKIWLLAALNTGGSFTVTQWAFPSGAFPTSDGTLYIATADHGSNGDPDYVASGTWFVAKTATPSGFSDFIYK